MQTRTLSWRRLAPVAAATLSGAGAAHAGLPLTALAATGTDGPLGPGLGAGNTYASIFTASVDASGNIVFAASLAGPGVAGSTNSAIGFGDIGGVGILVREGVATTSAGRFFGDFERPNVAGGRVGIAGFSTAAGGAAPLRQSRWVWPGAGTPLFAAEQGVTPAPGGPAGALFDQLLSPVLMSRATGATQVFRATMTGGAVTTANDGGIWAGSVTGGFSLAAREGDAAPGAGGAVFDTLGSVTVSPGGQIAHSAFLTGTGVDSTNNRGLWAGAPGATSLVARLGDAAPGMPAGASFLTLPDSANLRSGPVVVFEGATTGGGVTSADNEGIWVGGPGALTLLVREGDQAPGVPAGVQWSGFLAFPNIPQINSAGDIALLTNLKGAGVTTGNDGAIYFGDAGGLSLVAREGDAVGVVNNATFTILQPIVLNEAGQIVFGGFMAGPGISTSNDSAIFAWDETNGLTLVAREGETVDLGGGDTRTIVFSILLADSTLLGGTANGLGDDGTVALVCSVSPTAQVVVAATLPTVGDPADLTGDGVVDGADLGLLLGAWGPCAGCPADLTGDGVVDGADLGLLLGAWG
ncbi:MAG: choice-of-anchor tandem repeat NxxGxxAF-containing protein [Phycisphaerales bacterium]